MKELFYVCIPNIYTKLSNDKTTILPLNKDSFCVGCEQQADVGDLVLCSSCSYIIRGYYEMIVFFMNQNNKPTAIKCINKPIPGSGPMCGYSGVCNYDDCTCFDEMIARNVSQINYGNCRNLPVKKNNMLIFIMLNERMREFNVTLPRELVLLIRNR